MNKRHHGINGKIATEKQESLPKKQRLHFVLLRILLFLACVAVSIGIWLTVHYAEYLKSEGDGTVPSASFVMSDTCISL